MLRRLASTPLRPSRAATCAARTSSGFATTRHGGSSRRPFAGGAWRVASSCSATAATQRARKRARGVGSSLHGRVVRTARRCGPTPHFAVTALFPTRALGHCGTRTPRGLPPSSSSQMCLRALTCRVEGLSPVRRSIFASGPPGVVALSTSRSARVMPYTTHCLLVAALRPSLAGGPPWSHSSPFDLARRQGRQLRIATAGCALPWRVAGIASHLRRRSGSC